MKTKLFKRLSMLIFGGVMVLSAALGISNDSKTNNAVKADSCSWELVTSTPEDWSGTYILGNSNSGDIKILQASTFKVNDSTISYESATVKEGFIEADDSNAIVIEKSAAGTSGKYSVIINGCYVGRSAANSNGIDSVLVSSGKPTSNYDNSISISGNVIKIAGTGGRTLTWYGQNSNFRYYASSNNCTRLFKKVESSKTLSSVAIKNAPNKVDYYVGDSFDPTGLEITVTYDDESTDDISYLGNESKFTFSPSLKEELATDTSITIEYGGVSTTQDITITLRTMTGIEINGDISKTSYFVGDDWSLEGINIKINWSVGDPDYVDLDDKDVIMEISPENASSIEITSITLTVYYGDDLLEDSENFNVSVSEKPKEYVIDVDGGKPHEKNGTNTTANITSKDDFNAAFPQESDVNIEFVSCSNAMTSSFASGPSSDPLRIGSSKKAGSLSFRLKNADTEYITSIILDACGYNGEDCSLVISSSKESNTKDLKINSYSNDYTIEFDGWKEPTDFTISSIDAKGRAVFFAITVCYSNKVAASSVESFEVDSNSIILDSNNLSHQIIGTILPESANKDIIYSSNNEKVATVDNNGLIEAYSIGSATITCTTVGKNEQEVSLAQTIEVTVVNNSSTFVINKNSTDWPLSSSNTYSSNTVSLIEYTFRRFQFYNSSLELNSHTESGVEPSFGNSVAFSAPIKEVVIEFASLEEAGYASLYASESNSSNKLNKDVEIVPTSLALTFTYKFESVNCYYFTLVNDANDYMKFSSIKITLKNNDEIEATNFISKYMHPEVLIGDNGTGKCISENWYIDAKDNYSGLSNDVKLAFMDTEYFDRLCEWARLNGESYNQSEDVFNRVKTNPTMFGLEDEFSDSTVLLVMISLTSSLGLAAVLLYRKKKHTN